MPLAPSIRPLLAAAGLGLAGAAPAAGTNPAIEVPFDLEHNAIVVQASVNGQGPIGNIGIGPISIDHPSVVFYGKGTGRDQEAWGLRIGNAFFKDYIVTVDYPTTPSPSNTPSLPRSPGSAQRYPGLHTLTTPLHPPPDTA